jgi:hypothetical protein
MTELYISGLGMVPVFQGMGLKLRGAEVGVCRGENLAYWLEHCPNIEHVVAVDPWKEYYELSQQQCDEFYLNAMQNLQPFINEGRVRIDRDLSVNAAMHIPDLSLDFVYIDGDHTREAVSDDLMAWFSKVKRGGAISGHDYGYPAVNAAIHEFRGSLTLKAPIILVGNNAWYFIKGE